MRISEYINPNKYYSVIFHKDGNVEIDYHGEERFNAVAYASDLPGIGSMVVAKNRETGKIRIQRADFNVDIDKKDQIHMKKTALDLVNKQQ